MWRAWCIFWWCVNVCNTLYNDGCVLFLSFDWHCLYLKDDVRFFYGWHLLGSCNVMVWCLCYELTCGHVGMSPCTRDSFCLAGCQAHWRCRVLVQMWWSAVNVLVCDDVENWNWLNLPYFLLMIACCRLCPGCRQTGWNMIAVPYWICSGW